jgi:hypothetical protein
MRIDILADGVAFLGCPPNALCFGRELWVAKFIGWHDGTVLGEVCFDPGGLGREEAFDIRCVAGVFVGWGKKIVFPCDAEGLRFVLAEFCDIGINPAPFEGAGDFVPGDVVLAFLWLEFFPHRGLFLGACRRDDAKLAFLRHIPLGDVVEHCGMDVGEKPKLLDGAEWKRERRGDGLVRPVIGA